MTDKGAKGGYNSTTCPACRKLFVWSVAIAPHLQVRCTNDDDNLGNKRCKQVFTRSEWEYQKWQEDRKDHIA